MPLTESIRDMNQPLRLKSWIVPVVLRPAASASPSAAPAVVAAVAAPPPLGPPPVVLRPAASASPSAAPAAAVVSGKL